MITGGMSGSLRYFFILRTTMSESLHFSLSRRSRTPAELRTDFEGWRLDRRTQLQLLSPKVAESSSNIFLISASVGAVTFGGGGWATKEISEDLRLYRRFFLTAFLLLLRCLRVGGSCNGAWLSSSEETSESLEEEEELLLLDDDDELDAEEETDDELDDDEETDEELDVEDEMLLPEPLLSVVLLSQSLLSLSESSSLRSKS